MDRLTSLARHFSNTNTSAASSNGAMPIHIAVVGCGLVGKEFLTQLSQYRGPLSFKVVSIQRSTQMCRSLTDGVTVGTEMTEAAMTMEDLSQWLPSPGIMVDNTSSADVAASYPLFLRRGLGVATPNKKGFSASRAQWDAIASSGLCYHESSVGAGLPIISTLKDLVNTGDRIHSIQGVFSGTLSYIFNEFSTSDAAFSDVVKVAKEKGYTEPDPRDDLNGMDVARKLTILSRLAGLEPGEFPVKSLIPEALNGCTADEYMSRLAEFDVEMSKLRDDARSAGKVLRYVGKIDVALGKVSVALESCAADHTFASLKGSDNVVAFYTERYPQPLVVQGAGAGAAVTAMGVLSDVIKLGERLR